MRNVPIGSNNTEESTAVLLLKHLYTEYCHEGFTFISINTDFLSFPTFFPAAVELSASGKHTVLIIIKQNGDSLVKTSNKEEQLVPLILI